MEMRIAFTSSVGIGTIIEVATGGDVNHACIIYFDQTYQTNLVLGANANGLTIQALFNFDDRIVHTFSALQGSFEVGLRKNTKWLDAPYDYAGLIGMAAVEAERLIGIWQGVNPLLNTRSLFCSEFCSLVIRDSGYDILPGVGAGSIDPYRLCQAMINQPTWFAHKEGL